MAGKSVKHKTESKTTSSPQAGNSANRHRVSDKTRSRRLKGNTHPSQRGQRNQHHAQDTLTGPGEGAGDGASAGEGVRTLFPKSSIWLIHCLTMVIRLSLVCDKTNWWILHPDEVFQSIEVAHSEVYGYGFRPYEFLPPPAPNSTSVVDQQEASLGMFSMRSFLYPRIFITLFRLKECLGISASPFLVAKVFHALVAAHLPMAVYLFMLNFYRSADVATLAAFLISFSEHLTILGTHTLINSFLSPFLFLALACLEKSIAAVEKTGIQDSITLETSTVYHNDGVTEPQPSKFIFSVKAICTAIAENSMLCCRNSNKNSAITEHFDMGYINTTNTLPNGCTVRQTAHIGTSVNNVKLCNGVSPDIASISSANETDNACLPESLKRNTNNNNTESLTRSSEREKPLNIFANSTYSPPAVSAFCRGLSERDTSERQQANWLSLNVDNLYVDSLWRSIKLTAIGFTFGVACYIRVDILLFLVIFCSIIYCRVIIFPLRFTSVVLHLVCGFVMAVMLGGLDDYYCYGAWFLSPFQSYKFNVATDLSSALFGLQGNNKYVEDILLYSISTKVFLVSIFIFTVMYFTRGNNTMGVSFKSRIYTSMLMVLVVVFIIYSLQGHKEVRFLHNVIVVYVCIASVALMEIYKTIREKVRGQGSLTLTAIVWTLLMLYTVQLWYNFPKVQDKSNTRWAYQHYYDSNYINEGLDFISQQSDVTGVFSDSSIHSTGAYSVLHKDVPLFALIHYEFHEFDKKVRQSMKHVDFIPSNDLSDVRVSVLNRISNFITIENSPLLLKHLISQVEYNYILLKKARQFVRIGYQEVFSSGTVRVMKRSTDIRENEELFKIAESIPTGSNVTVLEYEGSWLLTMGLYDKAIERLKAAIVRPDVRVRVFQLLALSYRESGQIDEGNVVLDMCYKVFEKEDCINQQPKVVLHLD